MLPTELTESSGFLKMTTSMLKLHKHKIRTLKAIRHRSTPGFLGWPGNADWKRVLGMRQFMLTGERISIRVLALCLQIIYTLSLIHISEPTRRTPISYAV